MFSSPARELQASWEDERREVTCPWSPRPPPPPVPKGLFALAWAGELVMPKACRWLQRSLFPGKAVRTFSPAGWIPPRKRKEEPDSRCPTPTLLPTSQRPCLCLTSTPGAPCACVFSGFPPSSSVADRGVPPTPLASISPCQQ